MMEIKSFLGFNSFKDYILFIILFIIFVLSIINEIFNIVSLYFLIPLLFLYSVIKKNGVNLFKNKYIFLLLIFFLFLFFTGIYAIDKDVYFNASIRYLGVFLFVISSIAIITDDSRLINMFFLLYCLKFITIYFIARSQGIFTFLFESERAKIEGFNANTYGYFAVFALLSIFFLYAKAKSKKIKILLIAILFFTVYTGYSLLIYAASRAGFIMFTVSFLTGLLFIFKINWKKIMIGSLFILFVLNFNDNVNISIDQTIEKFNSSLLSQRFSRDFNEDSRFNLIVETLEYFKKSPLLGYGLGQFRTTGLQTMSHTSYTEALFEGGIVGLLLFLLILFEPLKLFSRNRIKRIPNSNIIWFTFITFVIYLTYNFFYVFYINAQMFLFFYLIRLQLVDWIKFKNY
ncbi:MAG TPA: hypothetical protein DD434_11130 [Bacteroidales bacterium]|nr:hypothetical protein [Bacteroidales bacterium]